MSKIGSGIVSAYVFFRPGKPLSRKVVASGLTSLFVYLMTIIVVKRGVHLDETQTGLIAAGAANLAGFCAGWLRKEFPDVVSDGQDYPQSSLAAPAQPPADHSVAHMATLEASPENVAAEASPASGEASADTQGAALPGPPPPAS